MANHILIDNGAVTAQRRFSWTPTNQNLMLGGAVSPEDFALAATTTVFASTPYQYTFKNRVINGDMFYDQRNGGSTISTTGVTAVDRWIVVQQTSAVWTAQRSTTSTTGYRNSLVFNVSTGATATTSQQVAITQRIEGYNVADLMWGTASAKTVTISFWVRASIAGTYGFSIRNNGNNRTYVTTYTISATNTWEYKTITIPGDTTSTWQKGDLTGMRLLWDLGSGPSTRTSFPNTWNAGSFGTTSAQANIIGTSGASFYLTGVQLEAGSVATPFELRPQELQLCQRYYVKLSSGLASGGLAEYAGFAVGPATSTTSCTLITYLPVPMRAAPVLSTSTLSSSLRLHDGIGSEPQVTALAIPTNGAAIQNVALTATVASGLTATRNYILIANNSTTAFIAFSSEL